MRVRATEDAVIRLLRAGQPLLGAIIHRQEDIRLPVFQSIEPVAVAEYGADGPGRMIVARARKEVWFVDIKRRSIPVTVDDVQTFLATRELVIARHTSQEITGWMVNTADYEQDAAELLASAGCLYTARALKR